MCHLADAPPRPWAVAFPLTGEKGYGLMNRGFLVWAAGTLAVALAMVVFLAAGPETAEAAFPGENGKIAYENRKIITRDLDFFETAPSDIFIANPDGSGKVNLTATPRRYELSPSVSPLGRRVAFAVCRNGTCSVHTVRVDGTDRKRITTGHSPAYSPDGKKLAFTRDGDVWTMGAGGGNQKNLTDGGKNPGGGGPAWSPDGSKIAYTSQTRGDIWTMDADDGSRRRNISGPFREENFGSAFSIDFSPDGKRVAFESSVQVGGKYGCIYGNVYTMDARGSAWENLTRNEEPDPKKCEYAFTNSSGSPAYSPDGERLAYTSGTYYDGVTLTDLDGSNGSRPFHGYSDGESELGNATSAPDWGPARPTP